MGIELPRREMLRLALMSSENRAASALARHYPGGTPAFVAAMNAKARGARHDAHALRRSDGPVAAQRLDGATTSRSWCAAAADYPLIREFSTTPSRIRRGAADRPHARLQQHEPPRARRGAWDIQLQKTGYIREAGRCLVMLAHDREQAVRHRAARLGRQVHAARRRAARQALARDRPGPAGREGDDRRRRQDAQARQDRRARPSRPSLARSAAVRGVHGAPASAPR